MKEQFIHKVTQSMLMWLEHQVCDDGEAYTNVNSQFYASKNKYNNYYTYTSPYDQFVSDAAVTGSPMPELLTGIYVSGNYTNVGQGGFTAVDFYNGHLYFDHEISNPTVNLTGTFAVKEVNVELPIDPDEELLFSTRYKPKMEIARNYNGQKPEETAFPVMFLKYVGGHNEPYALGGMDATLYKFKALVFAESMWQLEAIGSIFRDKQKTYVPILETADNPFNWLGYYKGATYNYDSLTASKVNASDKMFIDRVYINNYDGFTIKQRKDMPKGSQLGTIDFEVLIHRYPRS